MPKINKLVVKRIFFQNASELKRGCRTNIQIER